MRQLASMAKYLDVFTDFGFKKIFGEEANKAILIDFFNALLPVGNHVKELTFKNSERLGSTSEERKAIYDIYCENEYGEKFIVELRKVKQNYFKDRTIYYSTFPLSEQAVKGGDWDYNLKAVFCIGLLDFRFTDYNSEQEKKRVMHTVTLKDQDGRDFYDKLTYIYLEMPNFDKTEAELKSRLDKWLFFIKNLEEFQSIPEIFRGEAVFMEAFEKAELAKMNEEERAKYNYNLKTYRDNYSSLQTAKQEGIIEGIELEKWHIIKNLLQMGVSVADISRATGIAEAEILLYKGNL